jgi:hypothetical protein
LQHSISVVSTARPKIAFLWNYAGEACTGGDSEQDPGTPNPGAGLSNAIYDELPAHSTDALSVTVEWGTYSSDRVLRGHRLDNWLYFGASEDEKLNRREEVAAVCFETVVPCAIVILRLIS